MEEVIAKILSLLLVTFGSTIAVFVVAILMKIFEKIRNDLVKKAVYQAVLWASGAFAKDQNRIKFKAVMEKIQTKFKWLPADAIEELIESTIEEIKRTMPKKEIK